MGGHVVTAGLERAMERIVPAGVFGALCSIDAGASNSYAAEQVLVARAQANRQSEFLAARNAARVALARAGVEAGAILRDQRGLPVWPDGWLASITHCKGLCAAVAARTTVVRGLGLDLERTDRLRPSAARRVVHPEERSWAGEDRVRASILFSLKEAFFKAQYPRWKLALGFQDLVLAVDLEAGEARVQQLSGPGSKLPLKHEWRFGFSLADGFVLSLCCL